MKRILPLLLLLIPIAALGSDSRPQFQSQILNQSGSAPVDPLARDWTLSSSTDSMACAITGTSSILSVSTGTNNSGTPTEVSVTCGTSSTTLLAASTATKFIMVQVPLTSGVIVWVNLSGAASTQSAPSLSLAPGSEIDLFKSENSYLPTSAITCIAPVAQAVTVIYQ